MSGHLGGAALDVFPEEPLLSSSPLAGSPPLDPHPHLGGAAYEVADIQSEILLAGIRGIYENLEDWSGLPVRNPRCESAGRRAVPLMKTDRRVGTMPETNWAKKSRSSVPAESKARKRTK